MQFLHLWTESRKYVFFFVGAGLKPSKIRWFLRLFKKHQMGYTEKYPVRLFFLFLLENLSQDILILFLLVSYLINFPITNFLSLLQLSISWYLCLIYLSLSIFYPLPFLSLIFPFKFLKVERNVIFSSAIQDRRMIFSLQFLLTYALLL